MSSHQTWLDATISLSLPPRPRTLAQGFQHSHLEWHCPSRSRLPHGLGDLVSVHLPLCVTRHPSHTWAAPKPTVALGPGPPSLLPGAQNTIPWLQPSPDGPSHITPGVLAVPGCLGDLIPSHGAVRTPTPHALGCTNVAGPLTNRKPTSATQALPILTHIRAHKHTETRLSPPLHIHTNQNDPPNASHTHLTPGHGLHVASSNFSMAPACPL